MMKKQLLIKSSINLIDPKLKQIFQLLKQVNKNAVFFTKNSIILNPISIQLQQKFLITKLSKDLLSIIVKNEQWILPNYIDKTANQIHKVVEQNSGKDFKINLNEDNIQYDINIGNLLKDHQKFFRMNFCQYIKQTDKRIQANYFEQSNGRNVKSIYTNNNISFFVSTSPIKQMSCFYDNKSGVYTYLFSEHSINTSTGQIVKKVLIGWNNKQFPMVEGSQQLNRMRLVRKNKIKTLE